MARMASWTRLPAAIAVVFVVVLLTTALSVPAGADPVDPTTTSPTTTTTTSPPTTTTTAAPPTTTTITPPPSTTTNPAAPITVDAPSVTVTPNTNLVNQQTVTVAGTGFGANTAVGWAECKAGPGTADDCDTSRSGSTMTDGSGAFSATFVVRRMMHAPSGTLDCAAAPGTCKLGVGQLSNLAVNGSAIIDFDPNAPLPPPPVLQAAPTTNLVDGQQIAVLGTGFVGSTPVQMSECAAGTNQCMSIGGLGAQVNAAGTFLTPITVYRQVVTWQWTAFDCAAAPGTCELVVTSLGDPDATARIPLDFDSSVPIGTSVTITPDTGLANFQTVTVSGGGFGVAGEFAGVQIIVCKTGSTDAGDCRQNGAFAPLAADGTFTTPMTMRRLVHFPGGDFDCGSAPDACELRVLSFGPVVAFGSATFSFAPGPPPAPPAITVTPDTNLVSRQTVTVSGTGFAPDTALIVEQCLAGNNAPCAFGGGPVPVTDGAGAFTTTIAVTRGVNGPTFPPTVTDCADASGTCAIEAASFDDGDHAEGLLTFDPNVPVVPPVVTVTPQFDLPDRQVVTVDASGFQPGEAVYVAQCAAAVPVLCAAMFSPQPPVFADSSGDVHTKLRVLREVPSFLAPGTTNCAASVGECVLRVVSSAEPLASTDVPLGFDPTAVAPGPVLTVSPPGPWRDGQQVVLSGSGYAANAQLGIAECTAAGDFNGSTCAKSLFDPVYADADGNFSVTVTITRTFQSQDATIDCATVEGGCVLFAANRQDYGYERASVPLELAGAAGLLAFTGGTHLGLAYAGAAALGLGLLVLLFARRRRTAA